MMKTSKARILVVEDVELEAKLLMRTLADFGYHNITHRVDVAGALAAMESLKPQIIITDLSLHNSNGFELTRAVRARDGDYVYIIMLTGTGAEAQLREAFLAGVDDFVGKPYRAGELTARLAAGERIVQLETHLQRRSRELETALRRIDVTAAQRALAKASASIPVEAESAEGLSGLLGTKAWGNAEDLFGKDIGEFLQQPCAVVPVQTDFTSSFVADILLIDPVRQLEVGISVLADAASMKAMSMHLLGEDDPEAARALILELSNSMMGTLKMAMADEAQTFTGGIPCDTPYVQAREVLDAHQVRHRMAFTCGGANVELWLRAKEKKNAKVLGKDLKQDMVLGEDVHDARGILLMRAGTRLTQTSAERLARMSPTLAITVGNPKD